MLKTFMVDNETEWDFSLNLKCRAYNLAVHEINSLVSFEMTFGRKTNMPSTLATIFFFN